MEDFSNLSRKEIENKIEFYLLEIRLYFRESYSKNENESLETFIEMNLEKSLLQFSDIAIVESWLNQNISERFKDIIKKIYSVNYLRKLLCQFSDKKQSCEKAISGWLKKNKISKAKLFKSKIVVLAETINKDLNQYTYNTVRVELGRIRAKK